MYRQYNPDFAFFANDHTFIIPHHLCKYLDNPDTGVKLSPDEHLYAGHALKPNNQKGTNFAFNSGASGYFLSRKTMNFLVEKWDAGDDEECEGKGNKWLQGNPGLLVRACMIRRVLGSTMQKILDAYGSSLSRPVPNISYFHDCIYCRLPNV